MADTIDTAKAAGRRQLHFESLDEILADVERLAQCKQIRTLGTWSADQVLNHLATAMNKSIDGFTHRPPAVVRFIIRLLFKRRFLTRPMSPGFKLPARAQTELVPPVTSLPEGLDNFRKAIRRLRTEAPRASHPVFGALTAEEWVRLHCRHSELHLSFLVPAD
jgi:hypothetical protein